MSSSWSSSILTTHWGKCLVSDSLIYSCVARVSQQTNRNNSHRYRVAPLPSGWDASTEINGFYWRKQNKKKISSRCVIQRFVCREPYDAIYIPKAYPYEWRETVVGHWLTREIAQWVHHEGSIRQPIAPWVNALTITYKNSKHVAR